VDGLGNLKDYTLANEATHHLLGDYSLLQVVRWALNRTGLPLPLMAAVNLDHNATTNEFLVNSFINTESFIKQDGKRMNNHEILEALFTALNCRVYQTDGAWWVVRFGSYSDTFDYTHYDPTVTYLLASTLNPVKSITAPNLMLNNVLCLMESPTMQVELPVKTVKIANSLSFTESIVPGKFTEAWWSTIGNNVLWKWTNNGSISIERGANGTVQINNIYEWPHTKKLSIAIPCKNTGTAGCYFKIELFPFTDDATPPAPVRLKVLFKVATWYYGSEGWTESVDDTFYTHMQSVNCTMNQWNTFEVNSETGKAFTASDSITFEIYALDANFDNASNDGMLLKSVILRTDLKEISETLEDEEEVDEDNESDIDIELITGIAPATTFPHRNYLGALLTAAATRMTSIINGANTYTNLNEYLIDQYIAVSSQPREILSANIYGRLTMNDVIKDTNHDDTLYLVNSLTIDDKHSLNEAQLYEQP
jgi:hypothetical protein